MNTANKTKKLSDEHMITFFFIICWVTYFSTYVGRLNFSATMGDIIIKEGYAKSQVGLVAAAFFFAYGIGQFISGIMGDRISPQKMVFAGVFSSAVINLLMGVCRGYQIMVVLWLLNGLVQSMTWSPIARIVSDRLPAKRCVKACVNLSTTVPVGTLLTYLMCSLVIRYANWRAAFFIASAVMMLASFLWYFGIQKIENAADNDGFYEQEEQPEQEQNVPQRLFPKAVFVSSGLLLIVLTALLHGYLKDGIVTWVPTYLIETFHTGSALSVELTMVLSVTNLVGVYLSNYLNKKVLKNELVTAAVFFVLTIAALTVLICFGSQSIVLSLIMFAIITTSMLGVNTMIISVVPLYFKKYGKVSTVCGLLNSITHVGSAASSYGIGFMTQQYGWGITRIS